MQYRRRSKTPPSTLKLKKGPLKPLTAYIVSGIGLSLLCTLCSLAFYKSPKASSLQIAITRDSSKNHYASSMTQVLHILSEDPKIEITKEPLLGYTPLIERKALKLSPSCSLAQLDPITNPLEQTLEPTLSLTCDSPSENHLELDSVAVEEFLDQLPDHFSFMGRVELLIEPSSSQIVSLNPAAEISELKVLLGALNQSKSLGRLKRSKSSSLMAERVGADLYVAKP